MSTVESYVERVMRNVPRALPQRNRIEMEVRAHLMERVEAGTLVVDVSPAQPSSRSSTR